MPRIRRFGQKTKKTAHVAVNKTNETSESNLDVSVGHDEQNEISISARSEGESSGEQSCDSSDEGVGREVPLIHQPQHLPQHQSLRQPHQPHHNMTHHRNLSHQINNHQINHTQQNNSPRPMDRETKARDDFEALKTSLHPHLSSLASLAQGTSLSAPSSVFSLAGGSANFAYTPPAFLAPAPPPPAQPAGSASSSSSEGSTAGWSFEEQYKQVRQLYEISNDPGRKEFLDDLFAFMQRKGTPINRLPIMAKSVLDLYELYNLVVERKGLVEVILKKLWQEIIKGLKLPSSITSAAFTLRTHYEMFLLSYESEYMKYLYEYECEKKGFSTRAELDAAIEGNKREGRRTSGPYEAHTSAMAMPQINRVPPAPGMPPLSSMQTLGMSLAAITPRMQPCPAPFLEASIRFLQHQQEMLRNGGESPPSASAHAAALASLEASHNIFNLGPHFARTTLDQEPQREALNLSESPGSSGSGAHRRDVSRPPSPATSTKRPRSNGYGINHGAGPSSAPHRVPPQLVSTSRELTPPSPFHFGSIGSSGFSFRINESESTETEVSVSMDVNGVSYSGILNLIPKQQNGHLEEH